MVVYIDFEYAAPPGERPRPHCVVWATSDGKEGRMWLGDSAPSSPPYPCGEGVALCCYAAWAEMTCHLVLGWPTDVQVIDLYVEFRNGTNGHPVESNALLGALQYHGLKAMDAIEKKSMRDLAIRGGPYTEDEKQALLDYCAEDVQALIPLHRKMEDADEIQEAMLRGRFQVAVAHMLHHGLPIDRYNYDRIVENRTYLLHAFIEQMDPEGNFFVGDSFNNAKFQDWLVEHRIPWAYKVNPKGEEILDMTREAFRDMAEIRPEIVPVRALKETVSELRRFEYPVGDDDRHRPSFGAFGTKTGRNAHRKFIMGATAWLRALIKPVPGTALAYIDWRAQEFAISAVLSGDKTMLEVHQSGDVYLGFAKRAGAAPPEATKESHGEIRGVYKRVILGMSYGMGIQSLAAFVGCTEVEAKGLRRQFRKTFKVYYEWTQDVIEQDTLNGKQQTCFGWYRHLNGDDISPNSIQNWPVQSHGAEMLRLAASFLVEKEPKLLATMHDALMIEARDYMLSKHVAITKACMAKASSIVLDGYVIPTDVHKIRAPARYVDGRSPEMWGRAISLLDELDR